VFDLFAERCLHRQSPFFELIEYLEETRLSCLWLELRRVAALNRRLSFGEQQSSYPALTR